MSKQLFNLADKVIEFTKKFGEVQSEVVIKKNKDITAEARKENRKISIQFNLIQVNPSDTNSTQHSFI